MILINSNQITTKRTYAKSSHPTFGYTQNPEIIFDRIVNCLKNKDKMDVLLKITDGSDDVFWTKNTFRKVNNSFDVDVKEYTNQKVIDKVDKLYTTLINLENKVSPFYAAKYLDGYLESENVTLCKIIYHYLIA